MLLAEEGGDNFLSLTYWFDKKSAVHQFFATYIPVYLLPRKNAETTRFYACMDILMPPQVYISQPVSLL